MAKKDIEEELIRRELDRENAECTKWNVLLAVVKMKADLYYASKKEDKKKKNVELPEIPVEFKNKILEKGGTKPKFVIEKALTNSDCKKDQNRLFISVLDAADFLTENEKELIESDTKEHRFLMVELIEPNLEETSIPLKLYTLKKNSKCQRDSQQFVLSKPWYDIVTRNRLAENVIIQVWSFRLDGGKLGLAIVKLPEEGQEVVDVGTSTMMGGSDETSTSGSDGATTNAPVGTIVKWGFRKESSTTKRGINGGH